MSSLVIYVVNEEENYRRIGAVLLNNKDTIDPTDSDLIRVYFNESEMDSIWDQDESLREKFAIDLAFSKIQQLLP